MYTINWMPRYTADHIGQIIYGISRYATYEEAAIQKAIFQKYFHNRYYIVKV